MSALLRTAQWIVITSLAQFNLTSCHNVDHLIHDLLGSLPPTCTYFCFDCESALKTKMEFGPLVSISSSRLSDNAFMQSAFKTNFFCVAIIMIQDAKPSVNFTILENVLKKDKVPMLVVDKSLDRSTNEKAMFYTVPKVAVRLMSKTEEVFSISEAYKDNINMVNYWTENTGFALKGFRNHLIQSIEKARKSMSGMNLTVSVFGTEPWVAYRVNTFIGVDVKMLNILAEGLKFKYSFKEEKTILAENSTTGVIRGTFGSLHDGTSHIGIGNVGLSPARYRLADFSTILYSFSAELVSRKPAPKNTYRNLLTPFEALPWGLTCFCLVLFTLVFPLSRKVSIYEEQGSIWSLAISAFVILTRQRVREEMYVKPAMRVIYSTWLIGAGFLTAFYLSNLLASLMVIEYERPVDNLRDVLDLDRTLFIPDGTVMGDYFAATPRQDYQDAYKTSYVAKKGQFTMSRGWVPPNVERSIVEQGDVLLGFNFIIISRFNDNLKRYGRNPFRSGRESIISNDCAFPIQKHSPWQTEFDRILGQLRDMGFVFKFRRDATNYKAILDAKTQRGEDEIRPITIEQTALIFIFMLVGIVVGSALFVYEICVGMKWCE